ncbi:putative integral membrane protein [Rosellinia necatrix]|uniref:Putative integral membrane protein n=1 Tax=Rosellinia necatrix TaxID=77044 RepID=A0A1W2TCV0_ROSNE|nr:putative integral membrane protein [Rosellinia necatrix]
MALARLASILLRAAELVFATIVAGINGNYLHEVRHTSSWSQGRFIYTEVVAGIAIFFALIWLIPFSGTFVHWPLDFLISITWFVAFGLLVNYLDGACGAVFNWDNVSIRGDGCGMWKAVIAFSFLSAICWLASSVVGLLWVHDRETRTYQRRTWRSRV